MSKALKFGCVAAGLTLLVGALGGLAVDGAAREAVWIGAIIAFVIQVALFVLLFVVLLGTRPLLAHGLGMASRFIVFGALIFLWLPFVRLPTAPLLFSLVGVLFLTTLTEPFFVFRKTTGS